MNVIAPIMTVTGGGSYKQSIYYPFLHASKYGRGKVLKTLTKCGKYDSKDYTDVPVLDTIAVENEEKGELTIFAVTKDMDEDILTSFLLQGYDGYKPVEHIALQNDDGKAANSITRPDIVIPVNRPLPQMDNGMLEVRLPKLSWNVLRLRKKG